MRTARSAAALMLIVAAVALHADDWTSGKYTYNYSGEITAIGTDTFTYDRAGRLTSGTAGTGRKQEYSFDAFGNILTILTTDTNNTPKTFLAVDPATNRLVDSGDAYSGTVLDAQAAGGVVFFGEHDDRGNLVSTNGIEFFTYDDLNVMTTATTSGVETFHVYGADDERVGSITVNGPAAGTAKWTFRDLDGQVLRSIVESADGTLVWDADYIYHGRALLSAAVPTRHKVLQYHLDHLGTPRMVTANGGVEVARFTYYPFGRDIPEQPLIDTGDLKFTGHQRDTATRDYMHARYYSAIAGRFLSSDTGSDWDLREPESWNGFSYVRNSPIIAIDPDGLQIVITADRPSFTLMDGFLAGLSNAHQLDNLGRAINQAENLRHLAVADAMSLKTSVDGLQAFVDGFVPFADPFADNGYYSDSDIGLEYSRAIGEVSRDLEIAIASAGTLSAVAGRLKTAAGPLRNWIRVGPSYSQNLQQHIAKSVRWGASPSKGGKYLREIGSPTLRSFNQWLRGVKVPGSSWRVRDAGHFHIRR